MVAPERIGLNRIVARPLDPKEPVPPEGARNPAVVQRPGDDEDALSPDDEAAPVEVNRLLRGGGRGKKILIGSCRRDHQRKGEAEKKKKTLEIVV